MTTPARRKIGHRLGLVGWANFLRRIQIAPYTTAELMGHEVTCHNTVRVLMRRMHAVRLIHIGGWQAREVKCKGYSAIWHFGAGQDVPYPDGKAPNQPRRAKNIISGMVAFAALMQALEDPTTKADLQDATGLSEETIRVFLEHARTIGLVRIAEWQATQGDGYPAAMWQIGDAPDKRRPKPMPRAKVQRVARERRRAVADAMELHRMVVGISYGESA